MSLGTAFSTTACAPSDDSDQPAHKRRSVFAVRLALRIDLYLPTYCPVKTTQISFRGPPGASNRSLSTYILPCEDRSDCANAQADLSLRWAHVPRSILLESTSDRYRPDRNPVRPITVRYRFKQNADLGNTKVTTCTQCQTCFLGKISEIFQYVVC